MVVPIELAAARASSRGSDPGRTVPGGAFHLNSHFAAGAPPDPANSRRKPGGNGRTPINPTELAGRKPGSGKTQNVVAADLKQ